MRETLPLAELNAVSDRERPERAFTDNLMERICDRDNLNRAHRKVKANKGAPGVDGMTLDDLAAWIAAHKDMLIASLLEGRYQPQPVRGVQIPKPGGGVRQLGIPTVVDRLVQQAILQLLEPLFDPTFSNSSYGFRPCRSAHQALAAAQQYVAEGRLIVVDMDLEKFFDRVNHDILMGRLVRRVNDKRLLRIIRRFLKAGLMQDGACGTRQEGTPQGGPRWPWQLGFMATAPTPFIGVSTAILANGLTSLPWFNSNVGGVLTKMWTPPTAPPR